MTGPEPPTDVRLQLTDGRTLPLEVAYDGMRDGIDHWRVTVPAALILDGGAQLTIGTLPAHAAVVAELA